MNSNVEVGTVMNSNVEVGTPREGTVSPQKDG